MDNNLGHGTCLNLIFIGENHSFDPLISTHSTKYRE